MSMSAIAVVGVLVVIVLGSLFFAVAYARRPKGSGNAGEVDRGGIKRDAVRQRLESTKQLAQGESVSAGASPAAAAAPSKATPAVVEQPVSTPEVYAPELDSPADPIEVGITRRQVLNRSAIIGSAVGLASFGGMSIAFLIPAPVKGFGSKVAVTTPLDEIKADINSKNTPFYVPEAQTYLSLYTPKDEALAKETYLDLWDSIQASGLMPLWQKCPHLGCKVPYCDSSQWFECPCHGSQYNAAGEKKGGPAPRGMDRFEFEVSGQKLTINTGKRVIGPTIGTDTTAQSAEGAHCV